MIPIYFKISVINNIVDNKMKRKTMALFASLLASGNLIAEDDTNFELEKTTVVAVANKQARPIAEVIGSVSVITSDNIAETNSENIADVLRYEGNIQIENAGTRFGTTGINIRGIGKNRVAIEVDGITNAKQFSLGSYSNATSQFPETDLIKSIEILNGPASTLYGSDAIGGIVSIQTWDPQDLTRLSDDNKYTKFRLGYDGKTHGRVISALTAWDNESSGGVFAATQRDGKGLINHDSNHTARDFSDWDEQSLFSKFVVNTAGSNTLKFGFSGSQRDSDTQINSFIGQGRFSRTTELNATDTSDHYNITLNYDFIINNSWFDDGVVRGYYAQTSFDQDTFEKRSSFSGTPLDQFRHFEFQQKNTGIELNLNKRIITESATHNIIYGLDYTSANIEELRDGFETNLTTNVSTNSILGEIFPRRDFPNSQIDEIGVFIVDEISLSDSSLTIIPAIRFDYYDLTPSRDALFDANGIDTEIVSISEFDVSPKLGMLYQLNDESNIYAQYVRGFRAPPFDDVNIGLNIPLFNIRAIANPDLKSETSNGLELGYRFFGENNQFNLALFQTNYKDFIESKAVIGIDPETSTLLFQSRNIDKAEIYGFELAHHWQINDDFSSYSSLAWTHGTNKINNQPLNSISPAKAVNNLEWRLPNSLWNINLFSTFVKGVDKVNEEDDTFFKPSGYAVFDLFINRTIGKNQTVRFGVFNLTNKQYWNWQQVRNFDENDAIIDALSQPSTYVSLSYSIRL